MKLFAALLIAAGLSLAFNLDANDSHANPALEAIESIVACSEPVAEIAGEALGSSKQAYGCGGSQLTCQCFTLGPRRRTLHVQKSELIGHSWAIQIFSCHKTDG